VVVVVVVVDGAASAGAALSAAGCSAAGSLEVFSSCLLHAARLIARMLANRIVLFMGVGSSVSV
jgi:hypothetical protein